VHATSAARFICSHCSCNWHGRCERAGGREGGVLPLPYQEQVIGRWQMLIAGGGLSKRNEKWVAIESVTSSRE